jgi:hypothetical protein
VSASPDATTLSGAVVGLRYTRTGA